MLIAEQTQRNSRCGTQRANGTFIGSIIGLGGAIAYLAVSMSYENKDPAAALGVPVIIGIGAAIGRAFDCTRDYCIGNNNPRAETEEARRTIIFLNTSASNESDNESDEENPTNPHT